MLEAIVSSAIATSSRCVEQEELVTIEKTAIDKMREHSKYHLVSI